MTTKMKLVLTNEQVTKLSKLVGVSEKTVTRWQGGGVPAHQQEAVSKAMLEMGETIMPPEFSNEWLQPGWVQ